MNIHSKTDKPTDARDSAAESAKLSGGTAMHARGSDGAIKKRPGQAATKVGITIASSLEFVDVRHAYGEHDTLRDLSLSIDAGEVVSLLGPSGSGKTTLLRLAAGLAQPMAGEIRINQTAVSTPKFFVPPEKRGVGLVFQDYALFPHMSIRANVEFGLTAMAKAEREPYALFMLRTVGLEHKADKYPHHLSGGEQQRVALARALAPKPGVLLMDEPFSGLDGRLRESVREDSLSLLRGSRATVIVVTHDPEEALNISDRIALLDGGKIVQTGSCEDLYDRPATLFAARFFSEINQIEGEVICTGGAGVIDTAFGRLAMPQAYAGLSDHPLSGSVTVCVRPADLRMVSQEPANAAKRPRKAARADDLPKLATGWVRSKRFLGEYEMVEAVLRDGESRLIAKAPCGAIGGQGAPVDILYDPQKLLVYPV